MIIKGANGTETVKVGDRITFKAVTRWDTRRATRVVKAIDENGRIAVAYGGYSDFIVRHHEITEVIKS